MSPKGAQTPIGFDDVKKIALSLPDVEESTSYGAPAVKWRGKMLACVPVNNSAEANSLVIRVDLDHRIRLLLDKPDVYYITDHYVPHPVVLARLLLVSEADLRDLLRNAYQIVMSDSSARHR